MMKRAAEQVAEAASVETARRIYLELDHGVATDCDAEKAILSLLRGGVIAFAALARRRAGVPVIIHDHAQADLLHMDSQREDLLATLWEELTTRFSLTPELYLSRPELTRREETRDGD